MMWARVVMMLVVALVVGAAVNVGVAWVIAIRPTAMKSVDFPMTFVGWRGPQPSDWTQDAMVLEMSREVAFGRRWRMLFQTDRDKTPNVAEIATGWPLLALARYEVSRVNLFDSIRGAGSFGTSLSASGALPLWSGGITRHGWADQQPPQGTATILPTYPLAWGFAGNTVFYAACLAGPWLIGRALRRRLRTRRGLCGRCGYDIAGLAACPECGTTHAMTA